jgi:hypothetical protein
MHLKSALASKREPADVPMMIFGSVHMPMVVAFLGWKEE